MALNLEDITLAHIYEYVNNGEVQTADPKIVEYLAFLDKARAMHLRIDQFGHKDAIVAHFVKVDGLSRYLATNIYNDAMEYFYSDKQISRESWRNIIAQRMEKNYILAINLAKDTTDVSKANKMLLEMAKTLGLDQPDPVEVDETAYTKPFKMYSVDAEYLGLPKIDRRKLSQLIDELPELSETLKIRLKEEADVLPVKLFLDEHEDPRKS